MCPNDVLYKSAYGQVLQLDTLHEPKQALHVDIPPAIPVEVLLSDGSHLGQCRVVGIHQCPYLLYTRLATALATS